MSSDNGGIIGVVNDPTSTVASGVWQQEEQYEAKVNGTWPQRPLFTTKSLRINQSDSSYLKKTFGTATNRRKYTYSFWCKKQYNTDMAILSTGADSNNRGIMYFNNSGDFNFLEVTSGSTTAFVATNRLFRDSSAWYHFVIAVDTTQATNTNRVKIYVNGIQETSLAQTTYMNQNYDGNFNAGARHDISSANGYGEDGYYWNGYLAEVVFIDGQQLTPTSFGSTNSDGVWIPAIYTGTFGNNGFNLQFENAAALGTDSSANGNTFTVINLTSIDQSTDYPEVNFATLNSLDNYYGGGTFAEGNLKVTSPSGSSAFYTGTIGVSSGKWFWEVKYVSDSDSGANYSRIGITGRVATATNDALGNSNSMQYASINGAKGYNGGSNSYGSAYAPGDIIGVALDLDSGTQTITFYKNGSSQGAIDLALINGGTPTGFWFPAVDYDDGSKSGVFEINFGSPSFAISSGNTDGNGYGNFEYAVPSGYYSLNTKNLAEFG